jgi:hypothetical protein
LNRFSILGAISHILFEVTSFQRRWDLVRSCGPTGQAGTFSDAVNIDILVFAVSPPFPVAVSVSYIIFVESW